MDRVSASLLYVFDASLRVHDGAKPCLTFRFFCRRSCHFVRGFCAAAAAQHHHQVRRMLGAGPTQRPTTTSVDECAAPCGAPRDQCRRIIGRSRSPRANWAMRTHFFGLLFASVLQPLARNFALRGPGGVALRRVIRSILITHLLKSWTVLSNEVSQQSRAAALWLPNHRLSKRFVVQTHRYRLTKGCPPPP